MPNVIEAMATEKIICAMRARREQRALRCWYVESHLRVQLCGLRLSDRVSWTAVFCGVGERTLEEALQRGRIIVRDRLRPLSAAA